MRLTLKMEMAVAETVRDTRAGVVRAAKDAGEDAGAPAERARLIRRSAGVPAGSCPDDRDTDVTLADRDSERLRDIEYPDRLPRGSYCRIVDDLAADIGATVDWGSATVIAPRLVEIVPPPRDPLAVMNREMALSP